MIYRDKYKVRFNLGKGKERYKKWQVRDPKGEVTHYEPSEITLVMHNCILRNDKRGAKRIFEGGHKSVCAWIECDRVETYHGTATKPDTDIEVEYNPRKQPYWCIDGEDSDKKEIVAIYSIGRQLYTTK